MSKGSWRDCGMYTRLWQGLDVPVPSSRPSLPMPGDPEGVLLEIGANVGACTVELLLRTRASIVAFEPSPANLFFLTRNLRILHVSRPELNVSSRVVVMPVAIGRTATARARMLVPRANLGNTMLVSERKLLQRTLLGSVPGGRGSVPGGRGSVPGGSSEAVRTVDVPVETLDRLMPRGLGATRLIKVDVQGRCVRAMAAECAHGLNSPSAALIALPSHSPNAHNSAESCADPAAATRIPHRWQRMRRAPWRVGRALLSEWLGAAAATAVPVCIRLERRGRRGRRGRCSWARHAAAAGGD